MNFFSACGGLHFQNLSDRIFKISANRFVNFWRMKKASLGTKKFIPPFFRTPVEAFKFGLLKELLQEENFQNAFWRLKQLSNISILFQKERIGNVRHCKFLKIFH